MKLKKRIKWANKFKPDDAELIQDRIWTNPFLANILTTN